MSSDRHRQEVGDGVADRRSCRAPARSKPPGLSMTSSVTPCTMNMVESVTTIGCMPQNGDEEAVEGADRHADADADAATA